MRRAVPLSAVLIAVAVAAGAAYAATANTYTAGGQVKPPVAGTKAKPVPVGITTRFTVDAPDGLRPDPVARYEFFYPGVRTNGRHFPTCSAKLINAAGSDEDCPKGSLVGTGTTVSLSGAEPVPTDRSLVCELSLRAHNAPDDHLALFLFGRQPACAIDFAAAIDARFVRSRAGTTLVYDVPPEIIRTVPGVVSATVSSRTVLPRRTTRVKGRRVGFLEATGRCVDGERPIVIRFRTEGGDEQEVRAPAPC